MKKIVLILVFIPLIVQLSAQTLKEEAQVKIETLNSLIVTAKTQGLSVTKEEMTVRTAEIFLYYADWDEANKATNEASFVRAVRYKNNAAEMAELLPDFEREDVIMMLDEAITYINKLIAGEYKRNPIPKIDWSNVTIDKDRVLYENNPVFLGDYVWQPNLAGSYSLEEYHGDMDLFFVDFGKLANDNGDLNGWFNTQLRDKEDGTLGYIFLGNTSVPGWAETKYGPGFRMREDTFIGYDIDNPGARVLTSLLFKKVCAYSKGKKYSELGYMLCNEPHFYTTKKNDTFNQEDWDWASGPVSEYTFEKFRTWLANKHGNIANLNSLWGTNFAGFNDVIIDIPIWIGHIGTPMWYDWNVFNNYRVTQWFSDLKDTIRTYDPAAKIHLKVMPTMWTGNKRGHGIDMEAITNLSDIVGNDSGADVAPMWGEPFEWQEHYAYDWKELYMGFDFFKSVAPDKISFNSETHYLSTGRSRDLYLDPMYARATFWASATHGLDINQIWYWPRAENGAPTSGAGTGYAGSNAMQPRVTNEVHSTLMDLTANSDVVMAMQRQRKPLRIFYSETSAINKSAHMNDLFELYENLKFEGVPLGFATENIINTLDNSIWDAILLWKTEYVTSNELNALQNYLNHGGTLLIDAVSLKKSEYGQALSSLSPGNGKIINVSSLSDMHTKALGVVQSSGLMPEIRINETNTQGRNTCIWQCVKNSKGNNVLSVINVGKVDSKLNITLNNAVGEVSCKNLFNGVDVSKEPTLKPFELYFVELINATKPKVQLNFELPLANAEYIEGDDVYVKVVANDESLIKNLKLYLNDVLVRQVIQAPYEWGATNQKDQILQTMKPGSYILKAEAEDVNGSVTSIFQSIEVLLNDTIYSVLAPETITPDETVQITVNYQVRKERDVRVNIRKAGEYLEYVRKSVSGQGAVKITYTPSRPLAKGDDYNFQTYITTSNGNWAQRVTEDVNLAFSVVDDAVVGITDALIKSVAEVAVYPNPFDSSLEIRAGKKMQVVQLFQPSGQLQLSQKANDNSIKIKVGNLKLGLYFVKVVFEDGTIYIQKIIKE